MDLRNLFKNTYSPDVYDSGSTIFQMGDAANEMYVILEGEVEIRSDDVVFDTLQAGEIFGEMAIIDKQDRSASAVAKTTCKLGTIDEKKFLFMVQETPFFALQVMRIISDRLRKMDTKQTPDCN